MLSHFFDLYIPCTSVQESDFPVFKIQNFPYLLKFNPASFFSPFVSQSLFLLLISLPGSQSVSLFFHTLLKDLCCTVDMILCF